MLSINFTGDAEDKIRKGVNEDTSKQIKELQAFKDRVTPKVDISGFIKANEKAMIEDKEKLKKYPQKEKVMKEVLKILTEVSKGEVRK